MFNIIVLNVTFSSTINVPQYHRVFAFGQKYSSRSYTYTCGCWNASCSVAQPPTLNSSCTTSLTTHWLNETNVRGITRSLFVVTSPPKVPLAFHGTTESSLSVTNIVYSTLLPSVSSAFLSLLLSLLDKPPNVNTDAVYFEAGPLNQTIRIAPLATPPLNFLELVTLQLSARPCACARHYKMRIHTYTINNDIICSVNVTHVGR